MYGIVYHSLMDYLNDNHSSHKWNAIMSELPDYPAGGFLLFESYDDSTLLNMIGKAIETAKFEPADL
ncbi:MAG TPA: hypothetical protein EYN86_05395, partial [Planctomycetes bacterium]|nr:hypothetical protein [Planctomycetota bacterium]